MCRYLPHYAFFLYNDGFFSCCERCAPLQICPLLQESADRSHPLLLLLYKLHLSYGLKGAEPALINQCKRIDLCLCTIKVPKRERDVLRTYVHGIYFINTGRSNKRDTGMKVKHHRPDNLNSTWEEKVFSHTNMS